MEINNEIYKIVCFLRLCCYLFLKFGRMKLRIDIEWFNGGYGYVEYLVFIVGNSYIKY